MLIHSTYTMKRFVRAIEQHMTECNTQMHVHELHTPGHVQTNNATSMSLASTCQKILFTEHTLTYLHLLTCSVGPKPVTERDSLMHTCLNCIRNCTCKIQYQLRCHSCVWVNRCGCCLHELNDLHVSINIVKLIAKHDSHKFNVSSTATHDKRATKLRTFVTCQPKCHNRTT